MKKPIFFYQEIYQIVAEGKEFTENIYLEPANVAAFSLGQKDALGKISLGKNFLTLMTEIDNLLENSPIVLEIDKEIFQNLLRNFGSHLKAKARYSKIEFLSVLTSINFKKEFIEEVIQATKPTNAWSELHCIKFNLSIDNWQKKLKKELH